MTIYGDGSKERDFTHVDDIVDGLIKIWETQSYGIIFDLGSISLINPINKKFVGNLSVYLLELFEILASPPIE